MAKMLRAPHLSFLHFDTLGQKQMKKLNKTQDVIPSSRHSQQPLPHKLVREFTK